DWSGALHDRARGPESPQPALPPAPGQPQQRSATAHLSARARCIRAGNELTSSNNLAPPRLHTCAGRGAVLRMGICGGWIFHTTSSVAESGSVSAAAGRLGGAMSAFFSPPNGGVITLGF